MHLKPVTEQSTAYTKSPEGPRTLQYITIEEAAPGSPARRLPQPPTLITTAQDGTAGEGHPPLMAV